MSVEAVAARTGAERIGAESPPEPQILPHAYYHVDISPYLTR
jgi:hypothetical protein